MSRTAILRNGTASAQPFSSTLGEVTVAGTPRRKSAHDATLARQRVLDEAREEGLALGQAEGFEIGRAAGYQAGYDQAYAEASSQQSEHLRAFATELQQVHGRLEQSISEWYEAAELAVEDLAIEIAEKLIHAQLGLDRSFIVESTKDALRQLTEANRARIRVNPFDSVLLRNAREELLASTASLRGIEIVDDATILGGCVIETDRGAVDATVANRLKLLEGGMEGAA